MSTALIFTKYSKADIRYESSSMDTLRTRAMVRSHFESRFDGRKQEKVMCEGKIFLRNANAKVGHSGWNRGIYIRKAPVVSEVARHLLGNDLGIRIKFWSWHITYQITNAKLQHYNISLSKYTYSEQQANRFPVTRTEEVEGCYHVSLFPRFG